MTNTDTPKEKKGLVMPNPKKPKKHKKHKKPKTKPKVRCNSRTWKPGYICNPKTNRWVKKNGKVGKELIASGVIKVPKTEEKHMGPRAIDVSAYVGDIKDQPVPRHRTNSKSKLTLYEAKNKREMMKLLSKGGELLGQGREGTVYDLGDKVVKIGISGGKPMGPIKRKRFVQEVDLSFLIGEKGLGPKIYSAGIVKYGNKGAEATFFEMQKLEKPPKKGALVCSTKAQKQYYDLYKDLSKLKISVNDYNINNVMFKGGRFYLIDLGRAKVFKTSQGALQSNLQALASISRTISGSGAQAMANHAWKCPTLNTLVGLMWNDADSHTKQLIAQNYPTYAHKKTVSGKLLASIKKAYMAGRRTK